MKRLRYSKIVVSAVLANTFLFTWCLLIIFAVRGQEPAYLIEWYYKIVVGELGLLALTKLLETWRDKNDVDRDSSECDNTDDINDSYLQDTTSGGAFPERQESV